MLQLHKQSENRDQEREPPFSYNVSCLEFKEKNTDGMSSNNEYQLQTERKRLNLERADVEVPNSPVI